MAEIRSSAVAPETCRHHGAIIAAPVNPESTGDTACPRSGVTPVGSHPWGRRRSSPTPWASCRAGASRRGQPRLRPVGRLRHRGAASASAALARRPADPATARPRDSPRQRNTGASDRAGPVDGTASGANDGRVTQGVRRGTFPVGQPAEVGGEHPRQLAHNPLPVLGFQHNPPVTMRQPPARRVNRPGLVAYWTRQTPQWGVA